MKHVTLITLIVCGVSFAACNKTEDPAKISLTAQTALDSGNVAYRRGDYKASSEFFHQAARTDPKNVAGWYGIYMVESKLGNKAAADSAHAVVANLAPELPAGAHPTAKSAAPKNPHASIDGKPPTLPIEKARAEMKKETTTHE
jgi:hypothetical protein